MSGRVDGDRCRQCTAMASGAAAFTDEDLARSVMLRSESPFSAKTALGQRNAGAFGSSSGAGSRFESKTAVLSRRIAFCDRVSLLPAFQRQKRTGDGDRFCVND